MEQPTTTTFSFMEYMDETTGEYKPVIKFRNTSSSSLVTGFLRKNSNPNEGLRYGDSTTDEYSFYLIER